MQLPVQLGPLESCIAYLYSAVSVREYGLATLPIYFGIAEKNSGVFVLLFLQPYRVVLSLDSGDRERGWTLSLSQQCTSVERD